MSMISAQINELRELAGDGGMEWVAGPVRASVLREAADTIWQLRDDLQRANAENATLRQQLADATESMGRVEERCAKLRELVKDMWPHVRYRSRMCGECELPCDTSDECLLYEPMRQRMRELGVEVDG